MKQSEGTTSKLEDRTSNDNPESGEQTFPEADVIGHFNYLIAPIPPVVEAHLRSVSSLTEFLGEGL